MTFVFFICLVGSILLFNLPVSKLFLPGLENLTSFWHGGYSTPLILSSWPSLFGWLGLVMLWELHLAAILGPPFTVRKLPPLPPVLDILLALFLLTLPPHPYVFFSLGEAQPFTQVHGMQICWHFGCLKILLASFEFGYLIY